MIFEELTMGINEKTGDVYLIDVAPTQGQTADTQLDINGMIA
jgi:hypothetical protein